MSRATIEFVIRRLAELQDYQNRGLAVVLHGGEPLLLGHSRLERLLTGLRSGLGPGSTLALQTNGTLVNEDILHLFADTRTRVSVSLDGPRHVNDRFRIDHGARSTFAATVSAIERLLTHSRSRDFFHGVLAVVDPESDPAEVYSFFKALRIPSIDFLYRDGNYARLPFGKREVESIEYGEWMARLWDLYVSDPDPVPVECLDNLVRSLCGKEATKEGCGDSNFGILTIDTNGSISKNDTLKNSFDQADRFSNYWSISEHTFEQVTRSDEYLEYTASQKPTHPKCRNCALLRVCGGGMVLHRWSDESGYNNPSIYCHDQKFLVHHILETLQSVVDRYGKTWPSTTIASNCQVPKNRGRRQAAAEPELG